MSSAVVKMRPMAIGQAQGRSAGAVDEPTREGEESGADGAGDGQLVLDANVAEDRGPADQVVSEHGALQPGRVGVEVAGRDMVEPGAVLRSRMASSTTAW